MPFENPQAAPAPTRRSSRIRTAASEAPAAGATAAVSEGSAPVSSAPMTRRTVRRSVTVAEAVAMVAALTADKTPDIAAAPAEPVAAESAAEPFVETPTVGEQTSADPFEQAARTFRSVSGDVADAAASAPIDEEPAVADAPTVEHVARRRPSARKFLAVGATVGVMSLAGLLAVSMTLPAEAVAAVGSNGVASTSLVAASAGAEKSDTPIQAFVTSSDVQNETLASAEDFSTVSLVDLASEQGIKFSDTVFTNDPEAAIQWPFLVGVGMSSGYGPRWGRMHEGIDFVPGEGAPIQAIADGTVRIATEQGGGYGVTVYIDHVIDGQVITSHYSHMQYGSLKVKAGQTVKVGDIVGLTGNTGHSFGAHLHFEIIVNGKTIDPLPWLKANAGRYTLD
ncbi:hypothetical protein CQ047_02240 [Microbacterium sp. MYb72]|nr:hypothetical protein CQ047_02240 [Microbacterium sp. MYb72]